MTSERRVSENRRAITAFLDGMERHDAALIRSGLHADVVLRLPRPSMNGATIDGAGNLAAFLAVVASASYRDARATTDMLIVVEDHGVAEWRLRATLADGSDYDQYYCWTFDLRDGLIAEIREYIDTRYGLEKNGTTGLAAVALHA